MPILVQSFLNSATKLSTTATTATTVSQLKTLVNAIEGVSTSIMKFYIVNPSTTSTALVSGTLGSYVLLLLQQFTVVIIFQLLQTKWIDKLPS